MEVHGLFSKNQFGFRTKRSTTSALLTMTAKWDESEAKKESTGILLWDLSAAFDCIDWEIFLGKLKALGFDKRSIKWFRSFLEGRSQQVGIGQALSSPRNITTGCPQGSILSPLIFTIMTCDLELWVSNLACFNYADDTSTSASNEDVKIVLKTLEGEANNILKFMASNYLVANPNKTVFLLNSKKREDIDPRNMENGKAKIKIGDSWIEEEKDSKLLGLHIAQNLKSKTHVKKTIPELRKRTGLLKRLSPYVPQEELPLLAEGLFNSKIRYALSVYGTCRTKDSDPITKDMKSLQTAQNVMLRVITNTRRMDKKSIKELLQKTKMLSVNQMTAQHILVDTFKIMKHQIPEELHEKLTRDLSTTTMTTRRSTKAMLPSQQLIKKKCFTTQAISLWNDLPEGLRSTEMSIQTFKAHVKKIVVNYPI